MTKKQIDYRESAWRHLDCLTKPPRSLGRVEEIAVQLCGIQKTNRPQTRPRSVLIFAGDHGVCEEGVSPFPQSVTVEMLKNMENGGAAVSVLTELHNAKLRLIDMGSVLPKDLHLSRVERHAIRSGTRNMAKEPAMTKDELEQALETGREIVRDEIEQGARLIVFGEMGIGNTTPASAITAALLGCPVTEISGSGAGLNDDGLTHKIDVIENALSFHHDRLKDPYSILSCLGGFEIAAIVGGIQAAYQGNIPVLLDGFIISSGALVAAGIEPEIRKILIAAHVSAEPGHRRILESLQLNPILDLGMRLGEASGALVALPILDAAVTIFNNMATFESAGVSTKASK